MVTTDCIILRTRDVKEHHRLFTMYTRDHGKMEVMATGVRKITSKHAGHLTEESIIECTLHPGRDAMRLVHALRVRTFPGVTGDLQCVAMSHAAREVVDAMIRPGVADAKIFDLMERLYVGLEAHAAEPKELLQVFLYHLLDVLGLKALPVMIPKNEVIPDILYDHLQAPLASASYFFDRK